MAPDCAILCLVSINTINTHCRTNNIAQTIVLNLRLLTRCHLVLRSSYPRLHKISLNGNDQSCVVSRRLNGSHTISPFVEYCTVSSDIDTKLVSSEFARAPSWRENMIKKRSDHARLTELQLS